VGGPGGRDVGGFREDRRKLRSREGQPVGGSVGSPRRGWSRGLPARSLLVVTLTTLLVTGFSLALPGIGASTSPVSTSDGRAAATPPTPPPEFNCVGYGASLTVVSPSHAITKPAAGIVGTTFELEGSGYYNRTAGPLGNFTIWMANFSGGSLLDLAFIAAGVPVQFFVNVTVPSTNGTAPFAAGPYEFWSVENYTINSTCANAPFNLTAAPPPSIGCQSWSAQLLATSPVPANGTPGTPVGLQGRAFSPSGDTTLYWANASGSPDASVRTTTTSNPNGWFNQTIDVPSGYVAGLYVFWAIDGGSDCAGAVFNLTVGPTIALSPTTGAGGTEVTVTGAGFSSSDTSISITGPVLLFSLPCTLSGGSITGSCYFQVDGGLAGPQTITGVGNAVGGPGDTAFATFTLLPNITLNPSSGLVGSSLTISGFDFSAYPAAADVTLDGELLTPTGGSDCGAGSSDTLITPDAEGDFVCTFTVPTFATPGPNNVQGDDTSTGETTSEQTFTVSSQIAIAITITPTTGPVGTAAMVTGVGWTPSDYVVLSVGPVGDAYGTGGVVCEGTSGGEATVSATGGFTCPFDFPAVGAGEYSVLATDATHTTSPVTIVYSTNTFTVTSQVTITSTPTTGPVGTAVTVTGSGWTPSDYVQVGMGPVGDDQVTGESSCAGTAGGEAMADSTGGFTCSFDFPVVGAGEYAALAYDASHITSPLTIVYSTNSFTVTTPYVVSVSSTTGAPRPITFSVTGLAPDTVYDVYLDTLQGVASGASYDPLGMCTSSNSGSLTGCAVTIPIGLGSGTYFVDLFQDPAPPPFIFSVFNFTVTPSAATTGHTSPSGLTPLEWEIIAGAIAGVVVLAGAVVLARRRK
jgi:hypothetical protein